jgi:hypothetical protein
MCYAGYGHPFIMFIEHQVGIDWRWMFVLKFSDKQCCGSGRFWTGPNIEETDRIRGPNMQ